MYYSKCPVTIFVVHSKFCKYKKNRKYKYCNCRKYLEYYINKEQRRVTTGARDWKLAEISKQRMLEYIKKAQVTKTLHW